VPPFALLVTFALLVAAPAAAHGPGRAAVPPPAPDAPPAAAVVAEVRRHTERYLDVARAREDGFVQVTGMEPRHGYHFLHAGWQALALATGRVDLARPPMLLYVERDGVWRLAGVEYALPAAPARNPLPGAAWHAHPASCHYRDFREVPAASARECPPRHPATASEYVLWHPALAVAHVWAWIDNPTGPFAEENAALAPYGGSTAGHAHVRNPAEALYSELSHRVAGAMLLVLVGVILVERRATRFPWNAVSAPLWVLFGAYLFVTADPESWPLGPGRFADVFHDRLVLQHKLLALLPVVIGVTEGLARAGRVAAGRVRWLVAVLALAGSVALLLHFHDGRFHLDAVYLQHVAMAVTGLAVGGLLLAAARSARGALLLGWGWPALLLVMASVLLLYTER
jgi:hypothetical protein